MNIKDIFIKPDKEKRNLITPSVDDYNTGFFNVINFHNSGFMSLSAVYSAIELISNTIAEIPIDIKCKSDNKKTHKLSQHSLQFSLKNGIMTRFMLVKCLCSDMLRHGNGFAYINRADDGTVVDLIYCPAQDVTIFYNKKNREIYYKDNNICNCKIKPSDMIHIYKQSDDGINGVSVMKYASRTVESANYTENAALDYYAKGMNAVGLLHAKNPMRAEQAQQATKAITGEINTTKGNNIIKFIPFDLEYTQLSNDPNKSQMIESRQFNVAEIARYFNISPLLLQDLSHGSVADIESINIQFLTQCIQPILTIFEEEFNRKLISIEEQNTVYIDFDENELLRTNKNSTATYIKTLVDAGVLSRNEARNMLGLDAVDGGDDLTVSYSDIGQNKIS